MVIRVNNASQLRDALSKARGGETIELSGGNYGTLNVSRTDFKGVTLKSSSKSNPATFDRVELNSVSNLNFDKIKFKYSSSNTKAKDVFRVESSKKISITDSSFEGQLSPKGHGTGNGISVRRSSDVTLDDSDFVNFYVSMGFSRGDGYVVRNNTVSGMGHDGAVFAQVRNMLIEHNTFRDFKAPQAQHQDVIQFWTTSTNAPTSNVTIRNNHIEASGTRHMIAMFNEEARAGNKKLYYKDIKIHDNYITGSHTYGIVVDSADGVDVRNNTLERAKGAATTKNTMPLIHVSTNSDDVKILDNVVAAVPVGSKAGWTVSGNATSGVNYKIWSGAPNNKAIWLDGARDQKASKDAGVRGDVGASSASVSKAKASVEPSLPKQTPEKTLDMPEIPASSDTGFSDASVDLSGARTTVMGSGNVFRSATLTSDRVNLLKKLDFDAGDTLRFINYDSNTFRDKKGGNLVWKNKEGTFVRVDKMLDLQELVTFSPAISALVDEKSDMLVLRIEQKAGVHTVAMEGMGQTFLDAYQPELF